LTRINRSADWQGMNIMLANLLASLTCTYVHLPIEELSARLMPEEVRVGSVVAGGGVKGVSNSRDRQEEKGGGASMGGKEGKMQTGASSCYSNGSNGGKWGEVSSKAAKGGKEERTSSSSSHSGAGGDSKDMKNQADKGSNSSRTAGVMDGAATGKQGSIGGSAGGTKDQGEQIAVHTSSCSSSKNLGGGGCGKGQSKAASSSNSRESGSSGCDPGTRAADEMASSSNGRKGGGSSSNASSRGMSSSGAGCSSSSEGWEGDAASNVAGDDNPSGNNTPSSCKQPGSGALVDQSHCCDHSNNSSSSSSHDTDIKRQDSLPGGQSYGLSTTWEIAAQHTAAAVAYAKAVKAEKEAAVQRGEEPKEPLPFQFAWPGKDLEDVYSLGLFTNLTMGGVGNLPSPSCFPGTFGGQSTALDVQLVLELLLLCWPGTQVQESTVEVFPMEHMAWLRWDWLLLMISLLQQAPTEQKQQFLRERGPLLMQLLYQVLLEDEGLGGGGISEMLTTSGECAWVAWFKVVADDEANHDILQDWKVQWKASAPMAVTMVLQNLMFESLPESLVDPETARIGKVLLTPDRKYNVWGYDGVGRGLETLMIPKGFVTSRVDGRLAEL
jgi:hypothetical protein